MVAFNAVQSVLSVVLIISIGYILTAKRWLDDRAANLFSRLILNISLPGLMISNIMSTFDKPKLAESLPGVILPFLSMLLCYFLGILVSRLIGVKKARRGLFQTLFFVSNTIFIGLPVNIALFGETSVPYVLLYYIANTMLFWTLGVHNIRMDGDGAGEKMNFTETVKRILTPPLLGFMAAILLIFLGIKLPQFIMDTCKYLGNLTTPLSLLFIGITLRDIPLKEIRLDKDLVALLSGRFIFSPLIVVLLTMIHPLPPLMAKVFIIQAAMPVVTNSAVVSKAYGADSRFATLAIAISTLASLICIPIYMILMG